MILSKSFATRRRISVGLSLFFCAAFTFLILHEENRFLEKQIWVVQEEKLHGPNLVQPPSKNGKVLLPLGFRFPRYILQSHLKGTSGENWPRLQLEDSEVLELPPEKGGKFKKNNSFLYGPFDEEDCISKPKMHFSSDHSESVPLNLSKTFEIFLEEANMYGDSYNQHLRKMLEKYMAEENIENHWFRFSGTSVWLKDYNVHLVVSRLVLTETSDRNTPKVSLPLAQVFDQNWKELDVRLVFPSNYEENGPGFHISGQGFHSYRFPRILPVPFTLERDGNLWGAEDPRMMLVESRNGHDEPIIVFNSFHREKTEEKTIDGEKDKVKEIEIEKGKEKQKRDTSGFRSIFMSYPFQIQKGKQINGADNDKTKKQWFSLTKQLTIKGEKKKDVEKNWIPFVSGAREFQEEIFLITSLDPLKIIRCDLWTKNGECHIVKGEGQSSIGALRGGTPLISVLQTKTNNQEIFVGFARAHLTECGCGHHFYRPNLIVLARDGQKWNLTHISPSMDFGVKGIPWNPDESVCQSVNAILPNGIEFWDFESDTMSLYMSVADLTVERIHVKGILQALEEKRYWETGSQAESNGPIKCALDLSKEFCTLYGMYHQK